jgi:hypothetical protein
VSEGGVKQQELGGLKIIASLAGGQVDQVYPKLVFSILFVEEEKPPVPEPCDTALECIRIGPETFRGYRSQMNDECRKKSDR